MICQLAIFDDTGVYNNWWVIGYTKWFIGDST